MQVIAFARVEITRGPDGRFVIRGELDISTVEAAAEPLWAHLRSGSSLVVDLCELAFMDSQGLKLFLQLALHAERSGLPPVVLLDPVGEVRRVLEISIPHGAPGLAIHGEGT